MLTRFRGFDLGFPLIVLVVALLLLVVVVEVITLDEEGMLNDGEARGTSKAEAGDPEKGETVVILMIATGRRCWVS